MSVRNLPAAGSRSPQVMSQSWHPGVQNYPAHLNNSHKTNTDVINNFSDPVTSLRGRRRMHDANVSGGQTPVPIGKSASHSQVNIFTNNNGPHGRPDSASASGSKLPLNVGMKSSKDVAGSSILRGRSESDASTSAKLPTSSNTEEESPRANNATYSGRRIVNQTGVVPKLDLEDSQKWNTTAKPKNFNTNSAAGNQHQYSSDVGRPGSVDRATTKGATASVTSLNSSSQSRGRANTEAPIQ